MRQSLLISIIICSFFGCNNNKSIRQHEIAAFSMQEFVGIIRDSSFMKFKALVSKPGYEVDSSLSENEITHYSAGDTTIEKGDNMSVQMTKDRYINFLTFTTFNKKLYLQLERQISEMGFRRLNNNPTIKEFTLEKVYLTTVASSDAKSPSYMFVLVRDDRKNYIK
jgi:hypothetical protein